MSTSEGKKKFVFDPSVPPYQPENPDRRCLFLTFSNGFPLTEGQIFEYFTRMYGPYVEQVFVQRRWPIGGVAQPPLFGKVMFTHSNIPDYVMGNHDRVCVVIDGIPMYCRSFVSPKPKTPTTANATTSGDGSRE